MKKESFSEKFWNVVGYMLNTPCRERTEKTRKSAKKALEAAEQTILVCKNISNGSKPHKHL